MFTDREWEQAHHEAGHGVVGIAEDLDVALVSVSKAPDGQRICRACGPVHVGLALAQSPTSEEQERYDRLARFLYAGPNATKKFDASAHHGGQEDFAKVHTLACDLFANDSERASWKQRTNAEAWALVDRHWAAISQIARDLLNEGDQDAAAMRAAIEAQAGGR